MEPTRIWPGDAPLAQGGDPSDIPAITPYLVRGSDPVPAMLVCPGGGYAHLAEHEGEPVALYLNRLGIAAFVLRYRLAPYRFPAPLLDGQRALRWIRHYASDFSVDPERVGVLGFSAGGHLAAMLAHPPDLSERAGDGVDRESCRPQLAILAYPVTIMSGPMAHRTAKNLFGDAVQQSESARRCSLPDLVGDDNPPTFLWHTAEDVSVPVVHALAYAEALGAHQIPYALHVFERGRHGLGLDPENQGAQAWTELLPAWLGLHGFC